MLILPDPLCSGDIVFVRVPNRSEKSFVFNRNLCNPPNNPKQIKKRKQNKKKNYTKIYTEIYDEHDSLTSIHEINLGPVVLFANYLYEEYFISYYTKQKLL